MILSRCTSCGRTFRSCITEGEEHYCPDCWRATLPRSEVKAESLLSDYGVFGLLSIAVAAANIIVPTVFFITIGIDWPEGSLGAYLFRWMLISPLVSLFGILFATEKMPSGQPHRKLIVAGAIYNLVYFMVVGALILLITFGPRD